MNERRTSAIYFFFNIEFLAEKKKKKKKQANQDLMLSIVSLQPVHQCFPLI